MTTRIDGAAEVALGVARGDSFNAKITIYGIDLSNDVFTAELREYAEASGAALASFTVSTPVFADDNTTLTLTLPNAETDGVDLPDPREVGGPVHVYFDIKRTRSALRSTMVFGRFTIHGSVTQAGLTGGTGTQLNQIHIELDVIDGRFYVRKSDTLTQLAAIDTGTNNAVATVEAEGDTQVARVIDEGDTQVAAIAQDRQDALDAKDAAETAQGEAETARDKAQEWAESEGVEPGGSGTKSAKEWAADSETSKIASEDARDLALTVSFISESNALSSGDRNNRLVLTHTGSTTAFSITTLFDGDEATNGIRYLPSAAVAGDVYGWAFVDDIARVINQVEIVQSGTGTFGVWAFEGSNDGTTWTTLEASLTLGGAATNTHTISNTNAYKEYRLRGVSGTASTTVWLREINFRIGLNNDAVEAGLNQKRDEYHDAHTLRVLKAGVSVSNAALGSVPDQFRDPLTLEGSANTTLTDSADAGGNKLNDDRTITIGAGSYIEYPSIGSQASYDPDGYYYWYILPIDPTRTNDLSVGFQQNDVAVATTEFSVDRSVYGVLKVTYRNRNKAGGAAFAAFFPRIYNNGATDVNVLFPSLTQTDSAAIPAKMLDALVKPSDIIQPEIRTFEFWEEPGFFDFDVQSYLRNSTVAVDSVNGDDGSGDGSRFNPYLTLSAIGAEGSMSDGDIITFRRGSVFTEQLNAYFGCGAADCVFVADDRGKVGALPRISSWLTIDDADITDNGDGTWTFTFQPDASSAPDLDAVANNSYHRILVRERNAALDADDKPISAGTVLRWVSTTGELSTYDGSSYATYDAVSTTWTVTFAPRSGVTPKDGSNTYEVTHTRGNILHATGSTNGLNATFLGLHLDGAADGYGMVSSGTGSLVDMSVFTGGDTHHSVMASCKISRSLIASVGDTQDSITVSYSVGDNTQDTVTHFDRCFIFARGGPYAHNNTDETKRAKALVVERCHVVAERDPVTNAVRGGLGTADQTDTTTRRFNYAKNALSDTDRFASTFEPMVHVQDNYYDGIVRYQGTRGGTKNNIFLGTNWGDQNASAPANRGVKGVYASSYGEFTNNLCVLTREDGNFVPSGVSNYTADYTGNLLDSAIIGNGITAIGQTVVRRNIFVVYMPEFDSVANSTSIFNSAQTTFGNLDLDENIYVILDDGAANSIVGPGQDLNAPPTFIPPADTGGTADAITVTTGQSLASNPETLTFTAAATNTGAVTIAVDGLTAVDLKANGGTALSSGAISSGTRYTARLVSGEYQLCTFQSHVPGLPALRQKTGYEANGLIIDARGHPLGLNAVFRDFANRDLRWANTAIAKQISDFNQDRVERGLQPCGPSWTIDRQVKQITVDQAYHMISRRAPVSRG